MCEDSGDVFAQGGNLTNHLLCSLVSGLLSPLNEYAEVNFQRIPKEARRSS
jgi:hypothetical protein